MRMAKRKIRGLEGDESYFASMTDIMVGLLFIFVIIIMYFAFQLKTQAEQRENYANEAAQHRTKMLIQVSKILREQGVREVSVDRDQGILRFPAGVLFGSGKAEVEDNSHAAFVLKNLAYALNEVLRCSVFSENGLVFDWSEECREQNKNLVFVESIFIEGHTDDQPIRGALQSDPGINSNLRLSARRATNTYEKMISFEPVLGDFRSFIQEPVFAASAFGETRPIEINSTEEGRAANRRIDVRLIMYVPATGAALYEFKEAIDRRLKESSEDIRD